MYEAHAPGRPGATPTWASAAKSGVGTALNTSSRVWFSLGEGILHECYFPRVDQAATRDMRLIVTDGQHFFSDEQQATLQELVYPTAGTPYYRLINTCVAGRYRIEKEIIADPRRDCVLQQTRFVPLQGRLEDYRLYVALAPHLGNRGSNNTAWLDAYKGLSLLYAARADTALALACSAPWRLRSVGFAGTSDGMADLREHKQLTACYERAENGNVVLVSEVDLQACEGMFTLCIGFGLDATEAGHRSRASIQHGFAHACELYVHEWQVWQERLLPLDHLAPRQHDLYRVSMATIHTHEAKSFLGGIIASLSIPWGFNKVDEEIGGYHLVWPRDLVEVAGALLAAEAHADDHRVLSYLRATQEADGHWAQNMWLSGTPFWDSVQLDEAALPILLVDLVRREEGLAASDMAFFWPMVKCAAMYIVQHGPATEQDRWEENAGYTPFTLAAEIAALLVAAEMAEQHGEHVVATYLRETADTWNNSIEHWLYATGTDLAHEVGVEGYYVRITPPMPAGDESPLQGSIPIRNRPLDQPLTLPASAIVSPDALALVRFGLRSPHDPRIVNTVKVIDHLLKAETPYGPAWHRYNHDSYGEHADGAPFDGAGIGRPWPLLTGERAHFELAAGRHTEAERLLRALEAFSSAGGMLPEQIWDAPDIPERQLSFGRPSGSAMPLVWAHAEYVKLRRSLHEGRIFDLPTQTVARYQDGTSTTPYVIWRFNAPCRFIPNGQVLRVEVLGPAIIHWSADGWQTTGTLETRDTGLGVHIADVPTTQLAPGTTIQLTWYWPEQGRWEGQNVEVIVRPSDDTHAQAREAS